MYVLRKRKQRLYAGSISSIGIRDEHDEYPRQVDALETPLDFVFYVCVVESISGVVPVCLSVFLSVYCSGCRFHLRLFAPFFVCLLVRLLACYFLSSCTSYIYFRRKKCRHSVDSAPRAASTSAFSACSDAS